MKVTVTTRHIYDKEKNKTLKDYTLKKVKRLERYINTEKDPSEVKVILTSEKFRNIAEILVNDGRVKVNASVEMEDMHAAIDGVLDIIIKQLRRKSDKKIRTKRRANAKPTEELGVPEFQEENEDQPEVVTEKLNSKPMSVEEAILQLDLSEHGFVAFRDVENEEIKIVYRKNNSEVGLITQ